MADGGHEPSMEDILSSIKRIIAEDSDAALSGSRPRRSVAPARGDRQAEERSYSQRNVVDQDDVLELTDQLGDTPPAPAAPRVQVSEPRQDSRPQDSRLGEAPVPHAKTDSKGDAPLVSPSTVEASRTSLAALSALVVKPEPSGSDTLEGLVRDMLRPMIAQWLDARLPEIVERQVAKEVRRIVERG